MNNFTDKLKRLIPSKRKLFQLYAALLFNANTKGFITGNIFKGSSKQMCVPGLNCYSCPGAVGACPLGSLQGSFSADRSTIFYVGGILLLFGIIFGRTICGWMCPFGLIQELIYKIRTPKLKKSPVTRILSFLKYVILVFFVFIVPITYAFRDTPLPAFCKYICPAGTLEGGIGLLSNEVNASYFSMLGPLFTWKFALLMTTVVACVFIFRMFCRFICPLGAIYGFFNRISFLGVKVSEPKCTHCNLCVNHCKMDIKHVGDHECIGCGECIGVCPTKAISWKSPIPFLHNEVPNEPEKKPNKTAKIITRSIVGILLVIAIVSTFVYAWTDDSHDSILPPEQSEASDASGDEKPPLGNQVGNLCYGGDLKILTPDGITDDTVNPAATGKITVINFWGTWCTPCVNELPYFSQIATEYKDSVAVVAIHTNMVSETAPEYIKNHYAASDIVFACDNPNEGYYNLLGGRGTYPYTVIIDKNGVIKNVFVSSLHYEDLKTAIDAIIE